MLETRELQAVLAWSSIPFVGERSMRALLEHAREGRRSMAELWSAPMTDLARIVKLHPRAIAAFAGSEAERWRSAGADAETVRSWGVDLLLPHQPEYPESLNGGRSWSMLFAYGALGLLDEPRVAIANSAGVSNAGLMITDALADALARRDLALLTSTNREAYQAAATAAKRHAGPSVMVLDRGVAEAFPTGLQREPVATARVWDAEFDPDLQLLLSPFAWRERWSPRSGPRRDALVFDLADVVVAVDVQPDGTMDGECRRALSRGRKVIAVDRGADTWPGTRALWEDAGASRLTWRGPDTAAQELVRLLPPIALDCGRQRERDGWAREIGQFMVRACVSLDRDQEGGKARTVSAYPGSGELARIAAQWGSVGAEGSAGARWLLADLGLYHQQHAGRPAQLLERVARGGLFAAVLPAGWLEDGEHAVSRERWLSQSALRLAMRLPHPPHTVQPEPLAVVVLERSGGSRPDAPIFAPGREVMGRFHLRRYLQEVLEKLAAER